MINRKKKLDEATQSYEEKCKSKSEEVLAERVKLIPQKRKI